MLPIRLESSLVEDDFDLDDLLDQAAAAVGLESLRESAGGPLVLMEAFKKKFDKAKHPRWPKGTPPGPDGKQRAGAFMAVGQRFTDEDGKLWEVSNVVGSGAYAHAASGKFADTETKLFPVVPDGDGGVMIPGIAPAKPAKITGGQSGVDAAGQVTTISPYIVDDHDPSLAIPAGSKIKPDEWKRFGKLDQEQYIDTMERFGSWTPNSATALYNAVFAEYEPAIVDLVKKNYQSQFGASSGYTMSLTSMFLHGDVAKASAQREKAKALQADLAAVIQWDLYNRTQSPDVALFHKDIHNNSVSFWQKFVDGKQAIFSGQSQSHHYRAEFRGDIGVATPTAIRHVVLATASVNIAGGYKFEQEVSIPDRLLLDDRSFVFTVPKASNLHTPASKMTQGASDWLEGLTKNPKGGALLEQFKAQQQSGYWPTPPAPAHIVQEGSGGKLYLDPPPEAAEVTKDWKLPPVGAPLDPTAVGVMDLSIEFPITEPDGKTPQLLPIGDQNFKPGDYMVGKQGAFYWIGSDPGDTTGLLLRKWEIKDGAFTGESWTFSGSASKQMKATGPNGFVFPEPPPKATKEGGTGFVSADWSMEKDESFLGEMKKGDKFKESGNAYELLADGSMTAAQVQIVNLETGKKAAINTDYKTSKLIANSGAASSPTVPGSSPEPAADGEAKPKASRTPIGSTVVVQAGTGGYVAEVVPAPAGSEGSALVFVKTPQGGIGVATADKVSPAPKLYADGPEVDDTFTKDGMKWKVTSILKDGTVRARRASGGTVEKFDKAAQADLKFFRPSMYMHDPGHKVTAGSLAPGAIFDLGTGSKLRPAMVTVTTGGKVGYVDLDTGKNGTFTKGKFVRSIVPKGEVAADTPQQTPVDPVTAAKEGKFNPAKYTVGPDMLIGDMPIGTVLSKGGMYFEKTGDDEVTNLATGGTLKAGLKNPSSKSVMLTTYVPKSGAQVGYFDLTKGDAVQAGKLLKGDQFKVGGEKLVVVSLDDTDPDGGSVMHAALVLPNGQVGKDDIVYSSSKVVDFYAFKMNVKDTAFVDPDPSAFPSAVQAGFVPYASKYGSGGKYQHEKVGEMAPGTHIRDKSGKEWIVKSPGPVTVLSDGVSHFSIDGLLRGRALDKASLVDSAGVLGDMNDWDADAPAGKTLVKELGVGDEFESAKSTMRFRVMGFPDGKDEVTAREVLPNGLLGTVVYHFPMGDAVTKLEPKAPVAVSTSGQAGEFGLVPVSMLVADLEVGEQFAFVANGKVWNVTGKQFGAGETEILAIPAAPVNPEDYAASTFSGGLIGAHKPASELQLKSIGSGAFKGVGVKAWSVEGTPVTISTGPISGKAGITFPDGTVLPAKDWDVFFDQDPKAPSTALAIGDTAMTSEELDALPAGSVIGLANMMVKFTKNEDGTWQAGAGDPAHPSSKFTGYVLEKVGDPALFSGDEPKALRVGDNAMSAAQLDALPVGSKIGGSAEVGGSLAQYQKETDGSWKPVLSSGGFGPTKHASKDFGAGYYLWEKGSAADPLDTFIDDEFWPDEVPLPKVGQTVWVTTLDGHKKGVVLNIANGDQYTVKTADGNEDVFPVENLLRPGNPDVPPDASETFGDLSVGDTAEWTSPLGNKKMVTVTSQNDSGTMIEWEATNGSGTSTFKESTLIASNTPVTLPAPAEGEPPIGKTAALPSAMLNNDDGLALSDLPSGALYGLKADNGFWVSKVISTDPIVIENGQSPIPEFVPPYVWFPEGVSPPQQKPMPDGVEVGGVYAHEGGDGPLKVLKWGEGGLKDYLEVTWIDGPLKGELGSISPSELGPALPSYPLQPYKSAWGPGGKYKYERLEDVKPGSEFKGKGKEVYALQSVEGDVATFEDIEGNTFSTSAKDRVRVLKAPVQDTIAQDTKPKAPMPYWNLTSAEQATLEAVMKTGLPLSAKAFDSLQSEGLIGPEGGLTDQGVATFGTKSSGAYLPPNPTLGDLKVGTKFKVPEGYNSAGSWFTVTDVTPTYTPPKSFPGGDSFLDGYMTVTVTPEGGGKPQQMATSLPLPDAGDPDLILDDIDPDDPLGIGPPPPWWTPNLSNTQVGDLPKGSLFWYDGLPDPGEKMVQSSSPFKVVGHANFNPGYKPKAFKVPEPAALPDAPESPLVPYASPYGSGGSYKHEKVADLAVGTTFKDKTGTVYTVTGKIPSTVYFEDGQGGSFSTPPTVGGKPVRVRVVTPAADTELDAILDKVAPKVKTGDELAAGQVTDVNLNHPDGPQVEIDGGNQWMSVSDAMDAANAPPPHPGASLSKKSAAKIKVGAKLRSGSPSSGETVEVIGNYPDFEYLKVSGADGKVSHSYAKLAVDDWTYISDPPAPAPKAAKPPMFKNGEVVWINDGTFGWTEAKVLGEPSDTGTYKLLYIEKDMEVFAPAAMLTGAPPQAAATDSDGSVTYKGESLGIKKYGSMWNVTSDTSVDATSDAGDESLDAVEVLGTYGSKAEAIAAANAMLKPNPLAPKAPKVPKVPDYSGTNLDLSKAVGAGGTQGAKWATGPDGSKWLVKQYGGDEDRVATEILGNAIYRQMGAKAAPAGKVKLPNGKWALTYEGLDGSPKKITKPSGKLGEHYMTDALLANWDFIGATDDNILWGPDGQPFRVDQGGTLFYRAQGTKKPFSAIEVKEVESMLKPGQGQGHKKVFVTQAGLQAQAQKIADTLTPDVIDSLVDSAPFDSEKLREDTRIALKGRVNWMADLSAGLIEFSPAFKSQVVAF